MVTSQAPLPRHDIIILAQSMSWRCRRAENTMTDSDRIRSLVEGAPIVLFMKGTPQFPMCGFSSRATQALKECRAQFNHVNVLEDPEVRANLPRFSNWPTFPQLFVNGELIGGCDIVVELHAAGELQRIVTEAQKSA